MDHWGYAVFPDPTYRYILHSDTSGTWGYGAYWGTQWIQYKWIEALHLPEIGTKELLPIL